MSECHQFYDFAQVQMLSSDNLQVAFDPHGSKLFRNFRSNEHHPQLVLSKYPDLMIKTLTF